MHEFFDWESFYNGRRNKPGSEQRYAFKNTNHIHLDDTGFNLCLHAYDICDSANRVNFHDDMFPYGIGYNSAGSDWWFRLFSAERYTDQTYYTSDNDYVAGWVASYNFMLDSERFTLTSWNEYEFDHDATYATGNGDKERLSGAVTLWWNATSHIIMGIRYRYADDKLSKDFHRDAVVYSIKLNFWLITARAPGNMNPLYI